jgi:hypothetical protein
MGIVWGIAHMLYKFPGDFCGDMPAATINKQMIAVVIHYIEARPSVMDLPFEGLVDAWPCMR